MLMASKVSRIRHRDTVIQNTILLLFTSQRIDHDDMEMAPPVDLPICLYFPRLGQSIAKKMVQGNPTTKLYLAEFVFAKNRMGKYSTQAVDGQIKQSYPNKTRRV